VQNGKGSLNYMCRHHGKGCDQPARSNKGFLRAAVMGLLTRIEKSGSKWPFVSSWLEGRGR
jgi:hypothetical protein